jgi:hypothetical protein
MNINSEGMQGAALRITVVAANPAEIGGHAIPEIDGGGGGGGTASTAASYVFGGDGGAGAAGAPAAAGVIAPTMARIYGGVHIRQNSPGSDGQYQLQIDVPSRIEIEPLMIPFRFSNDAAKSEQLAKVLGAKRQLVDRLRDTRAKVEHQQQLLQQTTEKHKRAAEEVNKYKLQTGRVGVADDVDSVNRGMDQAKDELRRANQHANQAALRTPPRSVCPRCRSVLARLMRIRLPRCGRLFCTFGVLAPFGVLARHLCACAGYVLVPFMCLRCFCACAVFVLAPFMCLRFYACAVCVLAPFVRLSF